MIPLWDITINDFRDCLDRNSVIGKSVENRFFSIFGVPTYVKTHYAYQTSAFKPYSVYYIQSDPVDGNSDDSNPG